MSTVINTVQPCYGPEKETIVLSEEFIDQLQFTIEKENPPLVACSLYDWRKNLLRDLRYETIGYTSLWIL